MSDQIQSFAVRFNSTPTQTASQIVLSVINELHKNNIEVYDYQHIADKTEFTFLLTDQIDLTTQLAQSLFNGIAVVAETISFVIAFYSPEGGESIFGITSN